MKAFREHYQDPAIEKWDIFYYVYGVLHHPGYREKFADNLKRELPRIPLAPGDGEGTKARRHAGTKGRPGEGAEGTRRSRSGLVPTQASGFWAFSEAGKELAHWHLDYEQIEPYALKFVEKGGGGTARAEARGSKSGTPSPDPSLGGRGVRSPAGRQPRTIDDLYRVEDKMRLSKDKTELMVNPQLTLEGIPPEVYEYRLGNRSALEWVIDQYQVTTDKRSGIRSDPNRADDPEYIVRLVGQVVRVSLETVRIVRGLPERYAE